MHTSIPATISDASVYHKMDGGEGWQHMALMGAASLATWFKDQASLRAATALLEIGDNPFHNPETTLGRMAGNVEAGMVPGSALIRNLGVNPTDPYVRLRQGWEDYLKAALPGFSRELEPLRNVLGEPVNRANNTVGEGVFPVTLAPVATYLRAPELDELTRLYRATGYAPGADPKAMLFGFKDPNEVTLEDGRSLYAHALQARATTVIDGQTLKQALGELFNSPDYNEAVDADSGQAVTSRGDQSRGYMTRSVFERYNRQIKAGLGATSPIALKYLTAAAAKHRDDAYLNTTPIDDLVRNPGLYRTHGVDPEQYSGKITANAAQELLQAVGR